METFKKVFIKSESDLPKESKDYFVGYKNGGIATVHWHNNIKSWLAFNDWYLLPLESSQKEPAEVSDASDNLKEAIENALYATNAFTTGDCSLMAEGIIMYISEAGFSISQSLPQSQKTESADVEKFAQILGKCCLDNKVNLTSNERHTVYDAFKQYAQSLQVSQEARLTDQDYKAKYEKCIKIIKRLDAGIIGMYDL